MSPFTYSSLLVSSPGTPPTESVPVISVLPVTSKVLVGGLDVAVHVQLLGVQRPAHFGIARSLGLPDDADTTNMSLVPSLIFKSPFINIFEVVRVMRS